MRRRTRMFRFFGKKRYSNKIKWYRNRRRHGRSSRLPMRGPFLVSKERPPSPFKDPNFYTYKTGMRIRKRKQDHPRVLIRPSHAMTWWPYDIYHLAKRAQEKQQQQKQQNQQEEQKEGKKEQKKDETTKK